MTVYLIGVGADGDHIRPTPEIKQDGSYEYIPIAESWLTSEEYTFGSFPLSDGERTAADVVNRIAPFGSNGEWITDEELIEDHPVHHDPNFEELTFADQDGPGGTGSTLRKVKEGDVLGFYAGFSDYESGDKHRYLYGYFEINEVADLSQYSGQEYRDRLRDFPHNAHTKRLEGAGKPKHGGGEDGASLVIVDGREPARLLNTPVRMTEKRKGPPTYYVKKEFMDSFEVVTNDGDPTPVDIKIPLELEIDDEMFDTKVQEWVNREKYSGK